MTKTGYEFIINSIKEQLVFPPSDCTATQLSAWLSGYATCQHQIIGLIEEMAKGADNGRD